MSSGDDPIQIVTKSWPWKDLDGGFSQSLRPLFKHSLHTNNDKVTDDNIFNKDPLVSLKFQFSLLISYFTFQQNVLNIFLIQLSIPLKSKNIFLTQ